MTLTSKFFALDPISPRILHDIATECVNPDKLNVEKNHDVQGHFSNTPGQGLSAMVWTYSAVDGPLGLYVDPKYPEDRADFPFHHCVRINFDTPYGYDQNGEGCSMLHQRIIRTLAEHCDEQNVRHMWYNEFTGEYHEGTDNLEALL